MMLAVSLILLDLIAYRPPILIRLAILSSGAFANF